MTTTARTGQKAKPAKHDMTHGPIAAAFNASVWPLFMAAIGKATGGIPPWAPLVTGVVLAAGLIAAGMHRRPRPLSRVSLIYRASVVMTISVWLWAQLATFRNTGFTPGQSTALLVFWPGTAVLTAVAVAARRIPALFRILLPAVPFLIAAGLTVIKLGAVAAWLTGALAVTDQVHGFGATFSWLGFAVLTLAIAGAPLAVLGVTFANRELSADEELAAVQKRDAPKTPAGEGRKFLMLISKLSGEFTDWRPTDATQPGRRIPNLKITDVRFWDNGAGETYIIDLTGNEKGTTRTRLRAYTEDIITKMNLPHGCGVEILPARDTDGEPMGAGFAAVEISRVNVLKLELAYPELQPRSIMNQLPLGRTRSNKEIGPYLRESSAYLWGQKGSGKTGTIYDIIAGAMQCTDCLVWVIDLNRGNAARPFLRAWYEGRVDRPCIDWVATTIQEVMEMAQVGLDIALDRKSFYADLKFDANTNLMPIGNGGPGQAPPEILIVIDEGATVLGLGGGKMTEEGQAARESLNQIMDLARDAAVNIVFSGLRATADVADTAFMHGTAVRIGMRVTDDAELAYGFGDWKLSGKQIPYQGSGYIRCGHDDGDSGDDIQVFKAYYLDPKRMDSVGEEVTPWRPYLDERSLRTAGIRYSSRWRRAARLLWDNPPPQVYNYGSRPGDNDGSVIEGEVVSDDDLLEDTPAPAAGPTAPTGSTFNKRRAAGIGRPAGGSFDDLMAQAKQQDAARDALGGKQAAATPPGGGAAPDAYQPPAGPATTDAAAGDNAQTFNDQFEDLAKNMTVLDNEPERPWNRSGKITTDEEIAAAPTNSRDILERLVKVAGPLRATKMHEMLVAGGDWGPAVKISSVAMHKLLKAPGGGGPASWVASRATGDPYNHRDNVSG